MTSLRFGPGIARELADASADGSSGPPPSRAAAAAPILPAKVLVPLGIAILDLGDLADRADDEIQGFCDRIAGIDAGAEQKAWWGAYAAQLQAGRALVEPVLSRPDMGAARDAYLGGVVGLRVLEGGRA